MKERKLLKFLLRGKVYADVKKVKIFLRYPAGPLALFIYHTFQPYSQSKNVDKEISTFQEKPTRRSLVALRTDLCQRYCISNKFDEENKPLCLYDPSDDMMTMTIEGIRNQDPAMKNECWQQQSRCRPDDSNCCAQCSFHEDAAYVMPYPRNFTVGVDISAVCRSGDSCGGRENRLQQL